MMIHGYGTLGITERFLYLYDRIAREKGKYNMFISDDSGDIIHVGTHKASRLK